MSNSCVCLYLEFICIIEVYAHSRDHPSLEQSCEDLFGNCICDEVEVERVSPDKEREKNALVQRILILIAKEQQNLQNSMHVRGCKTKCTSHLVEYCSAEKTVRHSLNKCNDNRSTRTLVNM